jgi:hypothetical protein
LITGHGARSITGVEIGLDPLSVSEKQLEAIPGIGKKSAWALVSARVKAIRKRPGSFPFDDIQSWFTTANIAWNEEYLSVLKSL